MIDSLFDRQPICSLSRSIVFPMKNYTAIPIPYLFLKHATKGFDMHPKSQTNFWGAYHLRKAFLFDLFYLICLILDRSRFGGRISSLVGGGMYSRSGLHEKQANVHSDRCHCRRSRYRRQNDRPRIRACNGRNCHKEQTDRRNRNADPKP